MTVYLRVFTNEKGQTCSERGCLCRVHTWTSQGQKAEDDRFLEILWCGTHAIYESIWCCLELIQLLLLLCVHMHAMGWCESDRREKIERKGGDSKKTKHRGRSMKEKKIGIRVEKLKISGAVSLLYFFIFLSRESPDAAFFFFSH